MNWQNDLNINEVKEIRTRSTVYFGCGAINKISDIAKLFSDRKIDKVIVMSGRNAYKSTGAWDIVEKALKENNIGYINYDKVTPNPTTDSIDEAAKQLLQSAAVLRLMPENQLQFFSNTRMKQEAVFMNSNSHQQKPYL